MLNMMRSERMSTMFYRFSPDDARIRTPTAIRDRNVIRIPKMSGAAIYGPYVDLLAGRYDAVIHFDPGTPGGGKSGRQLRIQQL